MKQTGLGRKKYCVCKSVKTFHRQKKCIMKTISLRLTYLLLPVHSEGPIL